MMTALTLTGCAKGDNSMGETLADKLYVTIGEVTHTVTLEDNVATRAMVAALRTGDITYTAHDYGGFEKVGALDSRSRPTTTESAPRRATWCYTRATTSASSTAATRGRTPESASSTICLPTRCALLSAPVRAMSA